MNSATKTLEQSSNLLTILLLGAILLQVTLSASLLVRVDQVYRLAMDSSTSVMRAESTYVPNVSPGNSPTSGHISAPVTIVMFFDYACGACAQADEILVRIRNEYDEKVRVSFRPLPRGGLNHPSYMSALAAMCADDQNAFDAMHHLLFENTPAFDRDSLRAYASSLELDVDVFSECLNSRKASDDIMQNLIDSQSYGVIATPTMFINGQKVVGAVSFITLQREIGAALSR